MGNLYPLCVCASAFFLASCYQAFVRHKRVHDEMRIAKWRKKRCSAERLSPKHSNIYENWQHVRHRHFCINGRLHISLLLLPLRLLLLLLLFLRDRHIFIVPHELHTGEKRYFGFGHLMLAQHIRDNYSIILMYFKHEMNSVDTSNAYKR